MIRLPKLYKTSSTGKELEWEIGVIENEDKTAVISTVHGQVNGQLQTTNLLIQKGKNIGKINETSPFEQALSEAQSKWNKQIDKCYSEERGGASKSLSPMLAHKYEEHKNKVSFPSLISRKLDGLRCIASRNDSTISLKSRQGKEFVGLKHLREELLKVMKEGESWDGELYNKELTFQTLISLVKKDQLDSVLVEYHIYDVISDRPYEERFKRIDCVNDILLVKVLAYEINSHEEIKDYHLQFVSEGYEGAIIRVGECKYKAGHRSNQLLKVKSWLDEEFPIIGVEPDVHGTQGIFICQTKEGGIFSVRAKGEDEEREYYLSHPEEFIGKMLNVKFFEYSSSEIKIPRFPVGEYIRED